MTIYQNDWCGSKPIFYNTKTRKVGKSFNEVVDRNLFELDEEGMANYLEFGYCVFGNTIDKNVKFLQANEVIEIREGGNLSVRKMPDPVETMIGKTSDEEQVWSLIENHMHKILDKHSQEQIIIPLSGGLDSRILAYYSRERKPKTYTYGTSFQQELSIEAQNAKWIAGRLGLSWEQIKLENYYSYIQEWIQKYGPVVHTHGMYQMNFYDKVKERTNSGVILSGIIGDAWAGSIESDEVIGSSNITKLGYTHGLCISEDILIHNRNYEYTEEYLKINRDKLRDRDWKVVLTMRNKLMLLRYLFEVPESRGFVTESPFLDMEIALAMLNLPWERKKDRKWQREKVTALKLAPSRPERYDLIGMTDYIEYNRSPLVPLNSQVLDKWIRKDFVEAVNRNLNKKFCLYSQISSRKSTAHRVVNGGCNWLKDVTVGRYNQSLAYWRCAYLVLLPINNFLCELTQ